VLAWVFRRCDGQVDASETPIGLVPVAAGLDLDGLELARGALDQVLTVDRDAVRAELPQIREHLSQFGERLPPELRGLLGQLESDLSGDPSALV
jgi:phosphoenolpyruvate carboxykinase (GTP)